MEKDFIRKKAIYRGLCVWLLCICIWFLAAGRVQASRDGGNYVVTVYNERNGLPTGEANTVLETSDGYIWIGSYGGLIRYDGSNFRNFSQEGALASSSIRSLYEDREGRLWIGTNDAGAFVYSQGEFVKIENPADNSFLCIRDFKEGKDGRIYVASSSGIGEVREHALFPYEDERLTGQPVYALGMDSYGRLWGAMNDGICAVVKEGKVVGEVSYEQLFPEETAQIYCVTSDETGQIYLGTSEKILVKLNFSKEGLEPSDFSAQVYETENVATHNRLCVTKDGDILICGFRGFGWITPAGEIIEFPESQKAASVNSAAIDYEGNVWLASSSYGVIKYSKGAYASPNEAAGLEDVAVNTVARQGERFYVGLDQGLRIYEADWTSVENELTKMLDGIRVRHIISDSQNRVWLATYSSYGVVCYEPDTEKISCYNTENGLIYDSVRTLLELSDGRIAVGTQGGVNILDDQGIAESYGSESGIENTSILCLTEGKNGMLYAGSDGSGIYGIYNKTVENFGFAEGLGEGVVLRILPDADSDAYFVSAGSSLYYWKNGSFRKLDNFEKGAGSIFDFYVRDGKLWLLQNSGIFAVDKEKLLANEKVYTKTFLFEQGLTGSLNANTWHYMDGNGHLYMATRNGISVFGFQGVESCIPKGIIHTVSVDGMAYEHPEQIHLSDTVQRMTISFSALSYTENSEYAIAYQLEGFDREEVILNGTRTGNVSYTNLPGGNYTFHLRIYHPEHPEQEYQYQLLISKDKTLKERPLFWILLVILLVLSVAGLILLRARVKMNRINQQKKVYQRIVDQSMTTFAKTIDAKDAYTNGHSQRVAWYSREMARRMGMSEEEQERIYYIAMLHDIGKIGVPDQILNKPGRLTEEEWHVIQTHVSVGGDILKNFTALEGISEGARYHHERYDGKGYCEHKKGNEIPLTARIICVADTYDAMASDRCYRKALSQEVIREELLKGSGTQFDPDIVLYMLQMIEEGIVPVSA